MEGTGNGVVSGNYTNMCGKTAAKNKQPISESRLEAGTSRMPEKILRFVLTIDERADGRQDLRRYLHGTYSLHRHHELNKN